MVETERKIPRSASTWQLLAAVRSRITDPARFCLHLVLASTPLLAISGEVFGVVSLRIASNFFLFPLLGLPLPNGQSIPPHRPALSRRGLR